MAQWFPYLFLNPAAPGLIRSIPKKMSGEIVDISKVNYRCCLEESGQWPENVDRTHLALASGKLVKGLVKMLLSDLIIKE